MVSTEEQQTTAESTASSCASMRSDQSREQNPFFSSENKRQRGQQLTQRVQSSESSCVSMRSDQSREQNPFFSAENEQQSHQQLSKRIQFPASSCVSMRSDQSREQNPFFSSENEQESSRLREKTICQNKTVQADVDLQECLDEHQISLKGRYEHVTKGTDETKERIFQKIYTELYITEGLREEVHSYHEVKQLESVFKINSNLDFKIRCQEIFKVLTDQHKSIRVVLTSGVAGIGKTFSVQKFTLDWAEGLENQDISAVIPLSFREMNLIRDEQHSLLTLIQVFYPTFQKITAEQLSVCKLLFIFDGLDESRLSLDFNNSQVVSDVTQKSSINVLLTNLIQGHLLPSALVWITSRPAAANQIPPSCVSRVTEVRGFTNHQKEEDNLLTCFYMFCISLLILSF